MNPITFLRQVFDELKKVTWPTQQEVIRLTLLIIIICFAVGLFIGGIDLGLVKLFETLLK